MDLLEESRCSHYCIILHIMRYFATHTNPNTVNAATTPHTCRHDAAPYYDTAAALPRSMADVVQTVTFTDVPFAYLSLEQAKTVTLYALQLLRLHGVTLDKLTRDPDVYHEHTAQALQRFQAPGRSAASPDRVRPQWGVLYRFRQLPGVGGQRCLMCQVEGNGAWEVGCN